MSQPEQREEAVFEAALQLPADQRAAYLDQTCVGDTDLRRRVEALLGAFERAGGFLNQPATPERTVRISPPPTEKPGDRIGRYKLLQQIGEGGCGVVYMAEQEEPVRRRVALKVIKLGMDTKQVIARFEAERQALALMDHPNIARILDAGVTGAPVAAGSLPAVELGFQPGGQGLDSLGREAKSETFHDSQVNPGGQMPPSTAGEAPATTLSAGRPYFVMELVRGVKITEFCDEQQLPMRQRLELFIQVCSAVQHAHQKGIIHRDLKPSNILVTVNDGKAVPKVIDFGIAKATTGQPLTDKTLFTAFEQFLGTPTYMSPEQAVMTSVDIDTRSDIYSLGVLLYELLTGKTPFDSKELLQIGLIEMRRTICEKEPARPSTRLSTMVEAELTTTAKRRHIEPPKLIHLVRGDLDWIVMKCLEKDRARRYETANGLAADLRRQLANEPVVARPPSATYRFRKLVRRNQLAFTAAGAVLTALVIGLGVSLWQSIEKSRAYRRAVASEQKSREVAGFLKKMLNGVGPSVALGRDTKLLLEIVDETAESVGQDLKDQPEVEAELRNTLGEVYRALGENAKAETMQRRALELGHQVFGANDARLAEAKNNLALVLRDEGRFDEAEKLFREALGQFRKLRGNLDEETAAALNNLAGVLRELGRLPESEALQREGLEVIRKLHGEDHARAALCEQNLAAIVQLNGKPAEAEALARSALDRFRKRHGNDHPEVAGALANLGYVLSEGRKLDEAEAAAHESLALRRKLLAPGHPDIAKGLYELAGILNRQEKLIEAETAYREALTLLRERLGQENRFSPFVLSGLGEVLEGQGRLAEAEAMQREALEMRRRRLGDESPDTVRSLYSLARVRRQQGQLPEAESLLREALRTTLKLVGPDHPYTISAHRTLGLVAEDQRRLADAEQFYRDALAARRKISGKDHPDTAAFHEGLGRVLAGQGKFVEAEPHYREALTNRQARLGTDHYEVFVTSIGLGRMLADWAWAERPPAADVRNVKPGITARAREAERLLRDNLATGETQPTASAGMVGDIRSRLASAILAVAVTDPALDAAARQGQFAAAEKLLVSGQDLMRQGASTPPRYLRDGLERLTRLHVAWDEFAPGTGHAAQAAEFKQQLAEFDSTIAKP